MNLELELKLLHISRRVRADPEPVARGREWWD